MEVDIAAAKELAVDDVEIHAVLADAAVVVDAAVGDVERVAAAVEELTAALVDDVAAAEELVADNVDMPAVKVEARVVIVDAAKEGPAANELVGSAEFECCSILNTSICPALLSRLCTFYSLLMVPGNSRTLCWVSLSLLKAICSFLVRMVLFLLFFAAVSLRPSSCICSMY